MKRQELFHSLLDKVHPAVKQELDWSCAIVDRIDGLLKEKDLSRRDLAKIIGCNETQITRCTRGFPNYTLESIAKLSTALGEPLIKVL